MSSILDTIAFGKNAVTLPQIEHYYKEVKRVIDDKYNHLCPIFNYYFQGTSERQVEKEYKKVSKELDLEASLALLSVVEKTLRTDFICRCKRNQKKNADDAHFLEVFNSYDKPYKVRIKEDILDYWKDKLGFGYAHYFSIMKERIEYRNWLAHGRYWNKFGTAGRDKLTFSSLFNEVNAFLTLLSPYLLCPNDIGEYPA